MGGGVGGGAVANHTKGLRSAEKVAKLDKVNIFTHTRTHSRFDCLSLHTSAIQTQLRAQTIMGGLGWGVGWGGLQLPTIQRDSELLKKLPRWTRSTSLHTHARTHSRFDCLSLHTSAIQSHLRAQTIMSGLGWGVGWGGVAVANHTKGLRSAEKVAKLDKVNIFTHTHTHTHTRTQGSIP